MERLSAWRLPHGLTYETLVGKGNAVQVSGREVAMGLHARLSLDPTMQTMAQRLAECFTGAHQASCDGVDPKDGVRYEDARVRMAAMVVVDVPSGQILAASSANSPCHAHDLTRQGVRPSNCPDVPLGSVLRPHIPQPVVNHALMTQAPPGSLVKPLMMAGIIGMGLTQPHTARLQKALARSDSAQFLDAWLCRKSSGKGEFDKQCAAPELSLRAARQLGWNAGCERVAGQTHRHCGEFDLLTGAALNDRLTTDLQEDASAGVRAVVWGTLAGRFLVRPGAQNSARYEELAWPESMPLAQQRQACAQSRRGPYVKCGGERMGLISEGYGQGNARATAVGVASAYAALAASAQRLKARRAHLLIELQNAENKAIPIVSSSPQVLGIASVQAQAIVDGMALGLMPGGTSHAACIKAFGATACHAPLGIAGKTGTPGDADDRSLSQLHDDHGRRAQCLQQGLSRCEERYPLLRPRYRWYAGVMDSGTGHPLAFAALVHGNWRTADGRYADDKNAAAEMALHMMARLRAQAQGGLK
jgi:cell division protein FtsI/penicillin-binding protein 2